MPAPAASELSGYELLVGVCGGIAAYKVCSVVSGLVQRGAGVQVVMTESATHLVGPATFQALSGRSVFTTQWPVAGYYEQQHIQLTERADLFVIAPATANILAKAAQGLADDLVSTMILSTDCPLLFAPAMNTRMWQNPVVQENVQKLRQLGHSFLEPEEGWLACRTVGAGRLADPETIVTSLTQILKTHPPRLKI
ncbi:MAG: Coenzyme A biosynthesis bifunctional protein CoaBC [Phycisphaerae bacterium]|nr:Coenzyme A biosynthesis bifunctional protein CoaBC [Phycisphaerae bacterium]